MIEAFLLLSLAPSTLRFGDFPDELRRAEAAGLSGRVVVSIVVTAGGRVAQCAVIQRSGVELLDKGACRLVQAATYINEDESVIDKPFSSAVGLSFITPGLIPAGVTSQDAFVVFEPGPKKSPEEAKADLAIEPPVRLSGVDKWRYPRSASYSTTVRTSVALASINANGVPKSCDVLVSSGDAALDEETCHQGIKWMRYEPARHRNGKEGPRFDVWRVHWSPQLF